MIPYLGDFAEDATVYIPFNTFSSDDPAASVTITNLADADVKVHKDGSATQIVTDGATVSIDFDSITGNHLITIDTSVHADYATGSDYMVRIEGTTIDGGTVNAWVAQFSIENRFNEVDVVKWLGTAAATPTTAGVPEVDVTFVSGAAEDIATATALATVDTVVDGIQTDLSNGTDGLGAIKTDTAAILADTGTDGVLLAATATSAQLVDDVWDEVLTGGTHNVANSAGRRLRQLEAGFVLHSGTADAGAANTIDLETGVASATDDFYNHAKVVLTGGTGAGQERVISDYVGATQQATITPAWATNPDATSTYDIIPAVSHAETQGGGYAGGAVWIGPSGSTGAQLYVDGTVDNPIDDGQMANAKTVADALNLRIFQVEPGSSITLAATFDDYRFAGTDYTVALGGQSVSGTVFEGATITGNDDGSNTKNTLYDSCVLGENTLGQHTLRKCRLSGTTAGITLAEAGNYFWEQCFSGVAGTGTPKVTFGTGNQNLSLRHYSGGIQIENMGASASTDTMSVEGWGQVVEGTCTAGTVAIRGHFTTSGIANLTLSDDARIDVSQINAEVDTGISDAALATAAALTTAQNDLDTITGSDGVTLATSQGNYAPSTTTEMAAAKENIDWALTVLVGALSNAGTATETYTFTVDGTAYTVTYAGLDADGNRGTTVLSKV